MINKIEYMGSTVEYSTEFARDAAKIYGIDIETLARAAIARTPLELRENKCFKFTLESMHNGLEIKVYFE